MSAPAVTILSTLAEGMVDAALARGAEGGMRALGAALERYRGAGALSATRSWRDALPSTLDALRVLRRLDRDLLVQLQRT